MHHGALSYCFALAANVLLPKAYLYQEAANALTGAHVLGIYQYLERVQDILLLHSQCPTVADYRTVHWSYKNFVALSSVQS